MAWMMVSIDDVLYCCGCSVHAALAIQHNTVSAILCTTPFVLFCAVPYLATWSLIVGMTTIVLMSHVEA